MSKAIPTGEKGKYWYSYQDLLDREKNPVPEYLREDTEPDLPAATLSVDRYTSQEFFDLEVEKIWKKTWQVACRVSQVRKPGEYFVYDVAGLSILIVRTEKDELKAYYNSCLHRGRRIREKKGHVDDGIIACPFHGFSWHLDGTFHGAPCPWDFKHLSRDELQLPEVRLDTWGGWVFVNMDPHCQSLKDYLGIIPEHFERYDLENRYVSIHVEKVIRCNWKVAVEAFIESYHAVQTHPQIMSYQGIDNSQYDIWGDHISRAITPLGMINPSHIDELTVQDTLDDFMKYPPELEAADASPSFEDQLSIRRQLAEQAMDVYRHQTGRDITDVATDAEMLDSILYLVFPNFAPWTGYIPSLTYRHRPNGRDVDSCIMDIYFLSALPEGVDRLADTRTVRLGADDKFTDARALGERIGEIFEQDNRNMPEVQKGMYASFTRTLNYANYQEVRIRHFHRTLDKYLNA